MDKPGKEASQLRKQLREIERQRTKCLDVIVDERGPMIRGTYTVQGRRCGKDNCKCARGELHPIVMLSASVEGKTKNIYVRAIECERVRKLSRRYQRFRKARAELVKLAKRSAQLIDVLQALLTEPYPPGDKQRSLRRGRKSTRKR